MKRLLISGFAISLAIAAPTVLWAADNHEQGRPAGGHAAMGGAAHPAARSAPERSAPRMNRPMTSAHHSSSYHHTAMHHTAMHHTIMHHTTMRHTTTHHTAMHHVTHHTTTAAGRTAVRGHVDVSTYRRNITAEHKFHDGDYHGPAGYAYQRWGFGQRLPGEYYGQQFWISNYLNFGLMAEPEGYVWVRYGPDALLIDQETGDILQVEYGIFY